MVKMLTNLFNKRKREIERLNGVIVQLQQELRMCNTFATITNADKLEAERYLRERNDEVFGLKNEIKYLKMQINTTSNQINSRQY
jgi:peptidoglycan hydrolase CwlO-like protein